MIIDASVALKWFVQQDGSAAALRLLGSGEPLHAPDLIIAEVSNAAWRLSRFGRLTHEQVDAIAAELPGAFDELASARLLARGAVAIAAALDHPVYDCLYLALAHRLGTPMVTADQRLIAITRTTSWAPLVAPLA